MTLTSARLDDLRQRLTALRTRFAEVGARAAVAAVEVRASAAPAEALLDDLRATSADFDELRVALLEEASAFAGAPDPAKIRTLKALAALVAALERVEANRARRAAWAAARDNALVVLDRVVALVHREDKDSSALADCQAKARELHAGVSGPEPADLERETTLLGERIRPFVELVMLAERWNRLDDERCALLQEAIAQNFGRQLALAALRGKLGHEGEVGGAPEPTQFVPAAGNVSAATGQAAPAGYVEAAPNEAAGSVAAPAAGGGMPVGGAPAPAGVPVSGGVPAGGGGGPVGPGAVPGVIVTTPGRVVASGGPPVVPGGGVAPPGSPIVVEIRLSGDRVQVETPEQRREREELLERLADETAQWWVGARRGWEALVQRGLRPAEAARDTLERFPYLLSVPLAKSDEFDSGRLAEGYAILLQRIEKEEPGFVREALTRLNPQFTTRAREETYPLGQELYLYVVAEGRLYKTYPDFLKDVLVHVLPKPGVWLQGAITEANDSTTIVTRPEQPGGRPEQSRTLTTPGERFTTHTFSVTTGPLTTRFFSVQAGELSHPTDLDIHLKENGAPTDRAWIVSAPMDGKPEPPRRHRAGGTKVEQLGKQHRAVWIAAFNSDPNADKRYELTVALKRKAQPPPKPKHPQAAPAPSTFAKAWPFKKP